MKFKKQLIGCLAIFHFCLLFSNVLQGQSDVTVLIMERRQEIYPITLIAPERLSSSLRFVSEDPRLTVANSVLDRVRKEGNEYVHNFAIVLKISGDLENPEPGVPPARVVVRPDCELPCEQYLEVVLNRYRFNYWLQPPTDLNPDRIVATSDTDVLHRAYFFKDPTVLATVEFEEWDEENQMWQVTDNTGLRVTWEIAEFNGIGTNAARIRTVQFTGRNEFVPLSPGRPLLEPRPRFLLKPAPGFSLLYFDDKELRGLSAVEGGTTQIIIDSSMVRGDAFVLKTIFEIQRSGSKLREELPFARGVINYEVWSKMNVSGFYHFAGASGSIQDIWNGIGDIASIFEDAYIEFTPNQAPSPVTVGGVFDVETLFNWGGVDAPQGATAPGDPRVVDWVRDAESQGVLSADSARIIGARTIGTKAGDPDVDFLSITVGDKTSFLPFELELPLNEIELQLLLLQELGHMTRSFIIRAPFGPDGDLVDYKPQKPELLGLMINDFDAMLEAFTDNPDNPTQLFNAAFSDIELRTLFGFRRGVGFD